MSSRTIFVSLVALLLPLVAVLFPLVADAQQSEPVRQHAPAQVAGFAFGDSVAATRNTCMEAGHQWTGRGATYECLGGTPAPVPVVVDLVNLAFCEGRLCEIGLFAEHRSVGGASHGFHRAFTELTQLYGPHNHGEPDKFEWSLPCPVGGCREGQHEPSKITLFRAVTAVTGTLLISYQSPASLDVLQQRYERMMRRRAHSRRNF